MRNKLTLGFATDDESLAPKTVKRVDGTDTWCTIDEHIRRKGAELAEADLNGLKLRDLSLKKAQLIGADLSNSDIKNVDLSEANLTGLTCKNSIFENVDFTETKMDHAYFEQCIFKKCKFSGIPTVESPIKHASFISSDISNHNFYHLSFNNVDFSNSILESSSFGITEDNLRSEDHTIINCKMINVNLRMAEFGSNITNVDFSNSNLNNIFCSSIKLVKCNFSNTNLANSKFKESIIKNPISFENSVLYNADLSSSGIINSDFSSCNLINTRFHEAYLIDVIFPVDYKLPDSAISRKSSQEKGGCYIATIIYGDYNDLQVFILRQFRDRYLKKTTMGTYLIKIYYNTAPLLIKYIGHCKLFQVIVKFVLDRLVKKIS